MKLVRKFDSVDMANKLPVLIVVFSVGIATLTSAFAFFEERQLAIHDTEQRLSQVTHARLDTAEVWLQSVEDELITQAASPYTHQVLSGFSEGFAGFGDPVADLHQLYIADNPNPTGSKHVLDAAPDGSAYSDAHANYHGFFRDVLERYGYYDIFLINPDGDIVYTVFKELDFATNLMDGEYADSGLAEAFRLGRDAPAGVVSFVDYAPYAPSAGAPAAFLSTAIFDATGAFAGVLAYQLPSDRLLTLISNPEGLGETGEIYMFGPDGRSRAASRLGTVSGVLDPMPTLPQFTEAVDGQTALFGVEGLSGAPSLAVFGSVDVFGQTWRAVGEIDTAEVLAPVRAIAVQTVIQIVIAAIVISFFAARISRTITIPLKKVRDAMARVAQGDYDINLRAADRGDEIGFIATTLMEFCERLKVSDRLEAEARAEQEAQSAVVERLSTALEALSRGELGCQINETFPSEYEGLRADFNRSVDELAHTIRQVAAQAERIGSGAGAVSTASDDLSQRTENQAATLEETAASVEELTQSVQAAADGAQEVEQIVRDARSFAEESGEVVQSAVDTMGEIESGSGQIVQIISVIDDIAFQTNLLALNAGVEAARAGEAGRGFAVVASEVRALALRSSEAAKEIKTLISDSTAQVADGAKLVGDAGDALTSIVERVAHISSLISEIAQGAGEQATSLSEVNVGIGSLDQVTQQNAAMVQESNETAHELNAEADTLLAAVRHFQLPDAGQSLSSAA